MTEACAQGSSGSSSSRTPTASSFGVWRRYLECRRSTTWAPTPSASRARQARPWGASAGSPARCFDPQCLLLSFEAIWMCCDVFAVQGHRTRTYLKPAKTYLQARKDLQAAPDAHVALHELAVLPRCDWVRLKRPDGSAYTINVEYNQLDPLLRSTSEFAQGDAPDPGLLLAISLLPNMIFQVVASPSRRGQA